MVSGDGSLSPLSKMEKLKLKSKQIKQENDDPGYLPPLVSLKCQLCQQYLQDPVTLQCLHSFCRGCLEKYNGDQELVLGQAEPQEDDEAAEGKEEGLEQKEQREENRQVIQCPTCIEALNLAPLQTPQVPFENSRLARIVKLVYESNVVCQNCEDAASEIYCKTCNSWLCKPCEEVTHRAPIFKSHIREPLSHAQMMALPKCDKHPLNDLEFFFHR
mmetsp:Transcript_6726/g.7674  ORF Transcript_6726/g.7674 Transcript_6726/m.7674 type:complete len:216 (+) Transcript_6726:144-791(+)